MKHFFNYKTQSFYIDEINNEIQEDSIEISEQQHNELYNAINKGCVIFSDLSYSEPKPSEFHEWKVDDWVLNEQYKKEYEIQQKKALRDSLLSIANAEIDILNRSVRLRRATDADKKRLELLENYSIDLYELDLSNPDVVIPEKP